MVHICSKNKNNKQFVFLLQHKTFYDSQQLSNKQFFIKTKMENITNTDIKVKNSIHLIDHNYYTPPGKCIFMSTNILKS